MIYIYDTADMGETFTFVLFYRAINARSHMYMCIYMYMGVIFKKGLVASNFPARLETDP